ncbi:MAG: DUF354 domain-containing protein [Lachnospiraceae bacterium]|nr:DUF354 domain-containing protein [Lachnospiraceae bacterium]
MKILAIIPARKGSKGVPNKNIRLVNERPLVYYSIMNAKKSKWITDIKVSTDSEEVAVIAKQLGVDVHWRDSSLAGDEITLDAVIFDAMGNENWDYVVTMQPTSPTLQKETLDKAINYSIELQVDTLISVVNHPHLAWVNDSEGKKRPAYTERKNRQYLPGYYLETGAFVISRGSIITEKTRIGKNVDVYEISKEEAVDIDNFGDLLLVEKLLSDKKIAIYVNGNNSRGMGHIYRALETADIFYSKPDIFYDLNQTERRFFGETTHNLNGVDGFGELLGIVEKSNYDLIINDVLTTTADYMIALKKSLPDAKLVNFEDDGEGAHFADLVINDLYNTSDAPHIVVGEKYYIASKLFMLYQPIQIKEKVEKVFIGFGGADPQNYSDRLLRIISGSEYNNFRFTVVLGRGKINIDSLQKYNKYDNIEVLYDIVNMPEVMSECDIAITSRGRMGYELAILGIPTISVAQNKREESHKFVSNENGFSYLGLNPDDQIIEENLKMFLESSQTQRRHYQTLLLNHDLRNGRRHVRNLIDNL